MTIRASCELYLDGTYFPSTPVDAAGRRPVALAPLTLEWGRAGAGDQPDTATLNVTMRLFDPPDDLLAVAHVGTDVEVWAAGEIPEAFGGNTYRDGSFTGAPDGPAGPLAQTAGGTATIAAGVLRFDPTTPPASVWVPPAAFSATVGAWDEIPQAAPGQLWRGSMVLAVPAGVPWQLAVTGWTTPDPSARVPVTVAGPLPSGVGDGTRHTIPVELDLTGPAGPVWLGLGLTLGANFGRWVDQPAGLTWAAAVGTWAAQPVDVAVDDLILSPPATSRRVLVFSGSVSDLACTAVDDGVELELIAVDQLGNLGQRIVGDTPWPAQTIGTRFARIVTLTGLPIDYTLDPGVSGFEVTGRDVDAQQVVGLLRDLAQSGGGVLWSATHATTGPFLWLEDPAGRAAVRRFVDDGTGQIVIDNPRDPGADLVVVSACDLLRDPVAWRQASGDVVTSVDVSWLEQTLDDAGALAPTERHVTMVAPAAQDKYGVNRLAQSTELTHAADASTLAASLLASTSELAWRVDGITYDTALVDDDIDTLDPATRMQALMTLLDGTARNGLGLTLIDLPAYAPVPGDSTGAFVEGGTYTYDLDAWTLDLKLSPTPSAGESAGWSDMRPGWAWADMAQGISWADCAGTTVEGG